MFLNTPLGDLRDISNCLIVVYITGFTPHGVFCALHSLCTLWCHRQFNKRACVIDFIELFIKSIVIYAMEHTKWRDCSRYAKMINHLAGFQQDMRKLWTSSVQIWNKLDFPVTLIHKNRNVVSSSTNSYDLRTTTNESQRSTSRIKRQG